MVHHIVCPACGHDGPFYIAEITDDYVAIQCPIEECQRQQTLPVGMDEHR